MSTERPRLTRDRVLAAAIALADSSGIDALSMRSLAADQGVVPMALYKHVAGKQELLDGMVDAVLAGLPPLPGGSEWRPRLRERILATRATLLAHPWAPSVIETRTHASPIVLTYMDELMGIFRTGGFSAELTHLAMHALGIRMWGFTREVFPTPATPADPEQRAAMLAQFQTQFPHIVEIATATAGHPGSETAGCDAQVEFEFSLDALLDGLALRLAEQKASAANSARGRQRSASPR